uniref:Uncharacterized protein n=1 Tax=viral metagenome TaxID=1070528 RepID=A0A6C0CCX9_9ZZZZ
MAKAFVDEFDIIDTKMVVIFYDMCINKFRRNIDDTQCLQIIEEYKEKILSFVEHLRELETTFIMDTLVYLDKTLPALVDVVIMHWCLPRSTHFRSKQMYDNAYKNNIEIYNKKLIDNVNSYLFKNFTTDTISKTCNIPIHCIDILWYWLSPDLQFDFTFCNNASGNYLKFVIEPGDDYIYIAFNMESVLDMNLGNFVTNKGPFKHYIKNFIYNPQYAEAYMMSVTKKNYEQQSANIRQKYDKNLMLIQSSK